MEMQLDNFMSKIKILNKDLAIYKDEEKGFMYCINTVNLIARVDALELDKAQYEKMLFEKKIEKLEYNVETINRPMPKNIITKKDSDKFTIVDCEVKVKKVYNVSTTIGAYKSFINKEEALNYAEQHNASILDILTK